MIRFRLLVFILIFGGLGWLGYRVFKSDDKPKEEETEIKTDVAVQVAKLVRVTLHRTIDGYGIVEPEMAGESHPAASVNLAFPATGMVKEVSCSLGQSVHKEQTLVVLDSRAAEAALEQARQNHQFAQQEFDRQKKLLSTEGTSEKAVQQTENSLQKASLDVVAAQTALSLLQIHSPISGIVTQVNVHAGEFANAGAPAIQILDPKRVSLLIQAPAAEAQDVMLGQAVDMSSESGQVIGQGKVINVSPQIDTNSGAVQIIASLPAELAQRPGAWLRCHILVAEKHNVLAAPVSSVVKDKDDHEVVALVSVNKARQVFVHTGLVEGGLIEVQSPELNESDLVVTVGAYGLPKETAVHIQETAPAVSEPQASSPGAAAAQSPLDLIQTIPLPGVKGGFDMMAADVAGRRLFLCAQDNHSLEVIDLSAGHQVKSLPGFNEPKWAAYLPHAAQVYVATAGDGKVTLLDATSWQPIRSFDFREKANNLRYDPRTKELFVGIGKSFGALGIIDTEAQQVTGEVNLASSPKQFEIDGGVIYVNVPAANHVAVVDRAQKAVVATWAVPDGKENVPMGFDRKGHRLFVACDSGRFVAFDTASGKSVASLSLSPGADGLHYDTKRGLIYATCGSGFIEVIRQIDLDHYALMKALPIPKEAGTSLFVPEFDELLVPVPQRDDLPAELRVYRPRD